MEAIAKQSGKTMRPSGLVMNARTPSQMANVMNTTWSNRDNRMRVRMRQPDASDSTWPTHTGFVRFLLPSRWTQNCWPRTRTLTPCAESARTTGGCADSRHSCPKASSAARNSSARSGDSVMTYCIQQQSLGHVATGCVSTGSLGEPTAIESPSRLPAFSQGHIPVCTTPQPTLRLIGETALARVRRIEQVLRSKHPIDVAAIERVVLQDVKGLEAQLSVEAGVETQLDCILVRL